METTDLNSPPDLTLFSGQWEPYEEALYSIFNETLVKSNLSFQGLRVSIKRNPEYKGKHFSFWHLISEGEKEEERTPDFRRCERLSWIKWMIENCDLCPDICWWENARGSEKHIVIWHEKNKYAVILARRNGYFLIKTAYPTTSHKVKTFTQERDAFNRGKRN